MELRNIIKAPIVTEKNTNLREKDKYVFEVEPTATKIQIKRAAEKLFDVKVVSVNTLVVKGKLKRMGKFSGFRSDRKKAIIRLVPGSKIKQLGEV